MSLTTIRPTVVINKASMATSITSLPTVLQSITLVAYSITWSGTDVTGALSVQLSNDYALNPNGTVENVGTWSTMALSLSGVSVSSIPITDNTGNGFIDIEGTAAYAIRLVYTPSAGTGLMSAVINGKVS